MAIYRGGQPICKLANFWYSLNIKMKKRMVSWVRKNENHICFCIMRFLKNNKFLDQSDNYFSKYLNFLAATYIVQMILMYMFANKILNLCLNFRMRIKNSFNRNWKIDTSSSRETGVKSNLFSKSLKDSSNWLSILLLSMSIQFLHDVI